MPHTHAGEAHLDLQLESSELVLRGFTGEELEPAVLKGDLILSLSEATNLKEIQLIFTGTAKVTWRDSSTHHHDHPLFFHDFSFLNPSSSSTPHPVNKHTHSHTLKAGRHLFPFSLHVPGSLPASLRTYSGTCAIEYKLKAIATRPGFAADWRTKKIIRVSRGFGVDAVEYNQTLEIENTWPGKVMYAFTIPHKAYAAGETIPVSVKFSPLAKGVRIVSLVTTIREHTTVHSKSSSHSEARDATVVKYSFITDANGVTTAGPSSGVSSGAASPHPVRAESSTSLASMGQSPMTPTTPGFPVHGSGTPNHHGGLEASGSGFPGLNHPLRRGRISDLAGEGEDEVEQQEEQEVDDGHDTEVDVVVDVPIPAWTSPSHTVHPCFINHKIKWSAFIRNPDGHVSELRCALPIYILAASLAEEARLASAGSRNLLFGESGVLAHSDVPQVDLPSYQDHVMDRVANAETASYFNHSSGFAPTPWSHRGTPTGTPGAGTPMASPPHSRPPSRPPSPHRAHSTGHGAAFASSLSMATSYNSGRGVQSRRSSGTDTPITTSPPNGNTNFDEEHPEDHRNWIDSELMGSLAIDHTSPPGSNPASRPGSRPGSRPPSRPASPDRSHHFINPSTTAAAVPLPQTPVNEHPPPLGRSSTSSGGFFHLHIPKPLRPLTSFSRNGSSSNLTAMGRDTHSGSSSHSSTDHHPSASALSSALAAHAAKSSRHGNAAAQAFDVHTHSAMSNSPMSGPSTPSSPISGSPAAAAGAWPTSSSYTTTSSRPASPSPSHTPSFGRTVHDVHGSGGHGHGAHTPNWEEEDPLNSVPSYDVAARGFLGGGVVPISYGLPGYDDQQASRGPSSAQE